MDHYTSDFLTMILLYRTFNSMVISLWYIIPKDEAKKEKKASESTGLNTDRIAIYTDKWSQNQHAILVMGKSSLLSGTLVVQQQEAVLGLWLQRLFPYYIQELPIQCWSRNLENTWSQRLWDFQEMRNHSELQGRVAEYSLFGGAN